nr:MAG TPA: Terminase small subunit [Caudoviricetes sp.]
MINETLIFAETKFENMAGAPRKNIRLLRAAQDKAAAEGDHETVDAIRGQIEALIATLPDRYRDEYLLQEKGRENGLKLAIENAKAAKGQNVARTCSDNPRASERGDIIDLCSQRWGRSPIWENPIELLNAFKDYKRWADDHPVYTTEAIKSGNFAGQIIQIPRKHLLTVEEFTSFIGAPSNYLDREKARHESDFKEFGLDASTAFIEVIEKIKNSIADDMDRGAAAQLVDGTYVAKLRGFKTNMDYTSDGKAISGGLTVEVISPRTTEKVNQLKAFKQTHKDKDKEKTE